MTTLQFVLVSIAGGLVVLAVALIPVWMLLFQLHFGRKTMRRIAGERKGQLIEGGCCDIPAIAFRHGQSKFHLQFKVLKSNKTRRMLILTAPWPDDSRITIYRETFWTRAKSFLGLEDIRIGDSDFDNQYVLQSNRPARLPAILHPPARNLLMRIGFRDFGPSLNIIRRRVESPCPWSRDHGVISSSIHRSRTFLNCMTTLFRESRPKGFKALPNGRR